MIIARKVHVFGRVQGVFFRAWTAEQARWLGIAGWVRNCPDGSVEAHLEGEADKIERMIALLREGPPQARVDMVETSVSAIAGMKAFDVRH
jgi:acylphosphatase